MKNVIKIFAMTLLGAAALASCSDWTDAEALEYESSMTESKHGEAYYANLRAYKAEPNHPKAFAWYSDWTGVGADMRGQLMGMPDSMDFVSMWGNWYGLSEEKKEDLRKVQQIKGTRVLMCFIVDNIGVQTTPPEVRSTWTVDGVKYNSEGEALGAFWGWYQQGANGVQYGDTSAEGREKAIRKYANSIVDTINKYGWDGFDYDLEPNYGTPGSIASHADRNTIFLDELSKHFGPKSGTNRLLVVDGEPDKLAAECGEMLDYFLLQAYNDSTIGSIDNRLNTLFNKYGSVMSREEIVRKTILTVNFESYASTGGGNFTDRNGKSMFRLKGYATYTYAGVDAKIGGFGSFRMGFDYDNNYGYVREAIQAANPAIY